MRVAVFGAGAVGGHLAARLRHAGVDVSLVARGPHLAAIQANGLHFTSRQGDDFRVQLPAVSDARELGPQDLVIAAVKAQGLTAAAPGIAALLGPDTPVIYAVNGIPWWYFHGLSGAWAEQPLQRLDPTGTLWNDLRPERALGCVVQSANAVVAPGVIHNSSVNNGFVLGAPSADAPHLAAVSDLLRQGVPELTTTDDIRDAIWHKLLFNMALSPLACLTQQAGCDVAKDTALGQIFTQLMREGQAVAHRLGVMLEVDPAERLERMLAIRHRSSMLQDLEAGRPMEIDAQLVVVQDLARLLDVPTPTMDMVFALLIARARQSGQY